MGLMCIDSRLARYCFVGLFLLLAQSVLCASDKAIKANEKLLEQLDQLLLQRDSFAIVKEIRIDVLKERSRKARNAQELFSINEDLYREYRVFNSDSALWYANRNLELARCNKNSNWETTALLDQSFVLTANGLLTEAMDIMKLIASSSLPREQKSRYYAQMRTLYSRLQEYSAGNVNLSSSYRKLYNLYSDSAIQVSTPDESRYLYLRAWKYRNSPEIETVRQQLEEKKQQLSPDSRNYAILTNNLANIYRKRKDEVRYIENLILSAMADIRSVNRDIGSLQDLSGYLYNHGDINRAYRYISYCSEIAVTYRSRLRYIQVSQLQTKIHKSYIEHDKLQQRKLTASLVSVSLLSAILIAAFFFIRRQVKKRGEMNRQLDEANRMLQVHLDALEQAHRELTEASRQQTTLNDQLKDVNLQLREANYIKEEYIGYVFNICSTYISKMEEFRKNINRKLTVGQVDEVMKLVNSNSLAADELKAFYQSFDSIFLRLYPTFVEEFNALLQPDKQIECKDGELNTVLRIYALIRMGITDSTKIAEFLHCSPQTVYNNRMKTRNNARISKNEFPEAVQQLCRQAFGE